MWTAIALHTDPGDPLSHASCRGVGDGRGGNGRLGIAYSEYADPDARMWSVPIRAATTSRKRSSTRLHGIKHKPATTFGNVKADVLRLKIPTFSRGNFCEMTRRSAWAG